MKYYRNLLVAALLLIGGVTSLNAQTIVLEEDVNSDTTISNSGKNRKHYTGSFFSVGVPIGTFEGDSAPSMIMGSSWTMKYGSYYKYKLAEWYSILFQASYKRTAYHQEVEDPYDYNKLILNDANLEFSNRFNFGKRGDAIGNYLELGVSADYSFMTRNKTKRDPFDPDDTDFAKVKRVLQGMEYVEPLSYNAHARIGIQKWVLYGEYRLTDKLKEPINYQLPPLTLGVRIDLGA